jgi:Met-10+ like-protein
MNGVGLTFCSFVCDPFEMTLISHDLFLLLSLVSFLFFGGRSPHMMIGQNTHFRMTHMSTIISYIGPGSPGWITVTEQGIHYSFDVTRIMFSRGNITEKIRLGHELVQPGDVMVDLYGGIGYFTLPALVHGHASRVHVCEWNPVAVEYLQYNLVANGVADRATVYVGDCRQTAMAANLVNVADRVSLGLIPSSQGGWRTAVRCLRYSTGGWLHVHGNVPAVEVQHWSQWLCRCLHDIWKQETHTRQQTTTNTMQHSTSCRPTGGGTDAHEEPHDWITVCTHVERVKSFAPNVYHYLADVYLGPRILPSSSSTSVPGCDNNVSHNHHHLLLQQVPLKVTVATVMPNKSHVVVNGSDSSGSIPVERVLFVRCPETIPPPSCALSADGVLHQAWMR